MADGSPRFEIGAGADANQYLSILARVQAGNRLVKVIIYGYEDWNKLTKDNGLSLTDFDYETEKGAKTQDSGVGSRRIDLRRDKS